MNTDFQKYPTQFYGRTFLPWAGVLVLGPIVCLWGAVGVMAILDIQQQVDGDESWLFGLALVVLPTVLAAIFQVYVRQSPILFVCREGIKIREVWKPIPLRYLFFIPFVALYIFPFVIIYIAIVVFWRFVTWRLFQIQTFQLRWEHVQTIYPEKYALTIAGWCDKEHDDFEQDSPLAFHSFSYDAGSFGTSIARVSESVLFYLSNSDERETLPSWQEDVFFDAIHWEQESFR